MEALFWLFAIIVVIGGVFAWSKAQSARDEREHIAQKQKEKPTFDDTHTDVVDDPKWLAKQRAEAAERALMYKKAEAIEQLQVLSFTANDGAGPDRGRVIINAQWYCPPGVSATVHLWKSRGKPLLSPKHVKETEDSYSVSSWERSQHLTFEVDGKELFYADAAIEDSTNYHYYVWVTFTGSSGSETRCFQKITHHVRKGESWDDATNRLLAKAKRQIQILKVQRKLISYAPKPPPPVALPPPPPPSLVDRVKGQLGKERAKFEEESLARKAVEDEIKAQDLSPVDAEWLKEKMDLWLDGELELDKRKSHP